MNYINNKKNKTKIDKSRIIFIISLIFFTTSILTKINNTVMILKESKNNERKLILNNFNKQILKKEIKNHTEKVIYILDISDTLEETLNYIRQNYKDDTNLQVKIVLKDSIAGLNSISAALETMYSDLDNKSLNTETNNLASLLTRLMNSLDENNIEMVETIMNDKLSNEYNHWKSDIEKEFR